MSWLPIGPDFVFSPRNQNYKRLSKRNEWGRQGLPACIAVDQTEPATIYDVERPSSGGAGAFRTRNGGESWTSIADSLILADPLADPVWIDVNPVHANVIYLATDQGQGFYISDDRGDTWGPKKPVPGRVRIFRIEPNSAGDLAATRIIIGTNTGAYYSIDSGDTWTLVLAGDCHWLAIHVPAVGTASYFAGITTSGLHFTTVPTDPWTNLNTQAIGLPQYVAGPMNNFTTLRVEICPRNPQRVYVWLARPKFTEGIYTSDSPMVAWTKVAAAAPPNPGQGLYNFELAIAPNSPGDGATDILFIGSVSLFRSTDAGVTWVSAGVGFHADQQSFAFYPSNPPAAVIPVCYVGCDGGIGKSSKFCDPAFAFGAAIGYNNQDYLYSDSGQYENLNYAKQCSAVYQYASHSDMNALSYIGCQDTGVNAGTKTLGWRGIADADGGAMAIAPGVDGVKLWGRMGAYGVFPSFRIGLWTDKGEFSQAMQFVKLGNAAGPIINNTSNFEITPNNECLVGAHMRDNATTIALAIVGGAAAQFVIPASMVGIVIGTVVTIDQDVDGVEEYVVVTDVTVNSFSGVFLKNHPINSTVMRNRTFAVRIDQAGICQQISQDFGFTIINGHRVNTIISDAVDGELIICVTADQRVWRTDSGTTANSATVWNEVTVNKPVGGGINAIAITPDKHVYVLYAIGMNGVDGLGAAINTPLYEISTGNWIGQVCIGAPAPVWPLLIFGKLVAHPISNTILFASFRGKIYQLDLDVATGSWTFVDISVGLPGAIVYDLWAGFHSLERKEETVILRVAIPTRGVWEKVFNQFGQDDSIKLYVRDHFMDQGLLSRSEDGVTNPYSPTQKLYHYKCADVKLDSRQPGAPGGVPDFFQTDPEDALPISHVSFNKLHDNSRSLVASTQTMVHVQVHNRSTQDANNVKVWAIFCNASAGVPSLSKSASNADNFDFWTQFTAAGAIVPALPADSPWTSVDAPVVLNNVNGFKPAIASWLWNTPALAAGDPGHYCMVVFIHSADSPINEAGFNVDFITPRNRQIGQKNLHVGEPLPEDGTGVGGPGTPNPSMNEYVEFHNPTPTTQKTKMLFSFSRLPKELAVTLQFTKLDTEIPVADSISGIAQIRPAKKEEIISFSKESFFGRIWCMILSFFCGIINFILGLFGMSKIKCGCRKKRPLPEFEQTVYEVEKNTDVQVSNIRTAGYGFNAAYFRIKNTGVLPPGTTYSFDVLLVKNDVVIGGSEYHVRIAGDLKPFVFAFPPDVKEKNYSMAELHRLKRKAAEQRYLAPWIGEEKRAREIQMGKDTE